ncbi:MAG: choice-of-anchor D domain-containing protein, partial [Candidatus Hatepunaea meridiana]|nr:choice-of-anchor D domain-containing protein [Candidatus Hatepunaea meridiana]
MRFKVILITVTSFMLTAGATLFAQEHENVEQVGLIDNLWESARDVVVQGDYAYVAAYASGLQIIDISDPEHPEVAGYWDDNPDMVEGVSVSGNFVYLAVSQSGLYVIDVSDPANPNEIGSYDTPSFAVDVVVSGHFAYVADRLSGLRVIDISDPENPDEIGFCDTPGDAQGVALSGDFVYLADGAEHPAYNRGGYGASGLRVIDVSDPENPEEVGFYNTPGKAKSVAVRGDFAFVADYYQGLRVIDVSDPDQLEQVRFIASPDRANSVTLSGEFAYVTDYFDDLYVYDNVSNPVNLNQVGHYNASETASDVIVRDDFAYVTYYSHGLRVINISDPGDMNEIGICTSPGSANNVAVNGDYAYLATQDGLLVADVSDPENPVQLGFDHTAETGETVRGIAVNGDFVYLAVRESGLHVINISDPENPSEVGFYEDRYSENVVLRGNYIYMVDENLRVFDISDPRHPDLVGALFNQGGRYYNLVVNGNYAYISSRDVGLHVVDISDPENPDEVGRYEMERAFDVAVNGGYAYVADYGGFLRVIDVSDPEDPNEIGRRAIRATLAVANSEDLVYVATIYDGVRVIDVSNPRQPNEVGYYEMTGNARNVTVSGDLAFVPNLNKVRIFRFWSDGVPPRITVSPDTLDFSDVPVYGSAELTLTIVNGGDANLTVSDVSVQGTYFSTGFEDEFTIEPDGNHELTVTFAPDEEGEFDGMLTIASNDPDEGELEVSVTGSGVEPEIRLLGHYDSLENAKDVAASGGYAYVADYTRGLRIISVANPENPEEIGYCDTPGYALGVTVSDNYAYVADRQSGLRVISVADPEHPEEVGYCDTPDYSYNVVVSGDFAYVADRQSGLRVISVADPEHPEEVGYHNIPGDAIDLTVSGDYAYVVGNRGLRVISVADPEHPEEVGYYDTQGSAWGVTVSGDYAYVVAAGNGLRVISIVDLENMEEVGYNDELGEACDIMVSSGYVYLVDYQCGLHIINISDLENPDEADSYNTDGTAFGVFVQGEMAYVADGENGLVILDISDFLRRDNINWQIDISASVGDYWDYDNTAGAAADASWDFDEDYDAPEPNHAPEGFIQLYFPHPEWEHMLGDNFTVDIVPDEVFADTVIIWEFEVNTDQADQTVTLTFTPDDYTPDEYSLILLDVETEATQDLWENDTYEYNSGDSGIHEFMLIFGDQDPPEVAVTDPNGGEILNSGDEVQITWTAEDLTGIASSEVSFSIDGGETFTVIDTTYGDTLVLDWVIPDLYSPFCLVKVLCADNVGNEAEDQSDAIFAITPTTAINDFTAGWNLVSIPMIPEDGSTDAVFGDDIEGGFWVYDYMQSRGLARTNSVSCGPGYWLATTEDVSLDVEGEAYIDTVIFDLDQGWNLVGGSILWTTPLDCVRFIADEEIFTLDEAVDAELVQPILYGYLSGGENYTEEAALDPWLGYWFSVLGEDVQMLMYPVMLVEEEQRDEPDEPDVPTHESWQLT